MASKSPEINQELAELTWEQLEEWAGEKIVARGRSYLDQVEQPAVTPDEGLVAWVLGTRRYATWISLSSKGDIESNCTCPYEWGPCKHAVALVLTGIKALQDKAKLPVAAGDDERLVLLDGCLASEEEWDDDDIEETAIPGDAPAQRLKDQKALKAVLEKMKKAQLIDLALDLAGQFPEVGRGIWDRARLGEGKVAPMVRELRREIEELSSQPDWQDHWDECGHLPDYTPVRKKLTHLLTAGHADQVLELGDELWRLGIRQIEEYNDEGEVAMQIGDCMQVVMQAVKRSSLAPEEQILWFVQASLADDFDVLDDAEGLVQDGYDQGDWSKAADLIAGMLPKGSSPAPDDYSWRHRQNKILDWLIKALSEAGREDEVIPLLERQAPAALAYDELVDRLIRAGQEDEARQWAVAGFNKTVGKWEGVAWQMLERLLGMSRRAEDVASAGSYLALKFFHDPDIGLYRELEQVTEKQGLWPQVRQGVLAFLESGQRPYRPATEAQGTPEPFAPWPLPELTISLPKEKREGGSFPKYKILFEIAIHESRHDDALEWYQKRRKSKGWFGPSDERAAEALKSTHPGVAINIWEKMAEAEIARAKTSAYRVAGGHLRKARSLCAETGRGEEWRDYLQSLRVQHKPKWRLMEVLDQLERAPEGGRRIIEGKL